MQLRMDAASRQERGMRCLLACPVPLSLASASSSFTSRPDLVVDIVGVRRLSL